MLITYLLRIFTQHLYKWKCKLSNSLFQTSVSQFVRVWEWRSKFIKYWTFNANLWTNLIFWGSTSNIANNSRDHHFGIYSLILLYEHFNDHLIISYNHYFDSINQPVPFWDIPLLLSLSQGNLSKPFSNMAIIAFIT